MQESICLDGVDPESGEMMESVGSPEDIDNDDDEDDEDHSDSDGGDSLSDVFAPAALPSSTTADVGGVMSPHSASGGRPATRKRRSGGEGAWKVRHSSQVTAQPRIKIALSLYKVQQSIYLLDFQRVEVIYLYFFLEIYTSVS